MSTYRMSLYRDSERRTSDEKLRAQLEFIAQRALSGRHARGWTYDIGVISADKDLDQWTFESWIEFRRRVPGQVSEEREHEQWESIRESGHLAGQAARFGSKPWNPKRERRVVETKPNWGLVFDTSTGGLDVIDHKTQTDNEPVSDDPEPVSLGSISRLDPGDTYAHLIGLDAQIRMLLRAIQAAIDSDMGNRFHTLLHGKPGAGKTDVLLSTHKLLSSLNVSCLMIDATSTTEAGMRKLLLDEDELVPQVIFVEEVEKAPHSFKLLLGIMDERGQVSQMNFRRTATRSVKALVIASANDYNMLLKMDSGALLSRLNNEIYFPTLDRVTLGKILKRFVSEVKGGDEAWIEPTLEWCYDLRGITDPRFLKRVCLCGKGDLLSGKYQSDLERTMKAIPGNGKTELDMFD